MYGSRQAHSPCVKIFVVLDVAYDTFQGACKKVSITHEEFWKQTNNCNFVKKIVTIRPISQGVIRTVCSLQILID